MVADGRPSEMEFINSTNILEFLYVASYKIDLEKLKNKR